VADPPAASMDAEEHSSLEVVLAELDRVQFVVENALGSLDSRASFLLATAGVLIGTLPKEPSVLGFLAGATAIAAAACAVCTFAPRAVPSIKPRELFNHYRQEPADRTRDALMRARMKTYEADEARLRTKVRWMRAAIIFLSLSAVMALLAPYLSIEWAGSNN
jgi:hypothetical protein